MSINVRLLRRIAKHIAAEPRRYDQNETLEITPKELRAKNDPPCGTVGCIAGWACFLTGKTEKQRKTFSYNRAKKVLGLGRGSVKARKLFAHTHNSEGWPEKFRQQYENARSARKRVKVAVARIEHFIKTNGAE